MRPTVRDRCAENGFRGSFRGLYRSTPRSAPYGRFALVSAVAQEVFDLLRTDRPVRMPVRCRSRSRAHGAATRAPRPAPRSRRRCGRAHGRISRSRPAASCSGPTRRSPRAPRRPVVPRSSSSARAAGAIVRATTPRNRSRAAPRRHPSSSSAIATADAVSRSWATAASGTPNQHSDGVTSPRTSMSRTSSGSTGERAPCASACHSARE